MGYIFGYMKEKKFEIATAYCVSDTRWERFRCFLSLLLKAPCGNKGCWVLK